MLNCPLLSCWVSNQLKCKFKVRVPLECSRIPISLILATAYYSRLHLQHPFIELSFHCCPTRPERLLKSILCAPESISEAHHVKGATFFETRASHMSI